MSVARYLVLGLFISFLYLGYINCESPSKISTLDYENLSWNPLIAKMIKSMNETEINTTTYNLQSLPTRRYGTPGNLLASSYIYDKLSTISGLKIEHQSRFNNIILTLPGAYNVSNEIVIVGAHYDSISDVPNSSSAPGATDDACGVAIVLEMARIMCQYQFNDTIIFAFWNLEEDGQQGSRAYVENLSKNSRVMPFYINFDSPCYDPKGEFILDLMYKNQSYFAPETTKASKQAVMMMTRFNTIYGINFNLTYNVHPCGSDYKSFWSNGYSAVMTHSQTHGPAHTQFDTINNVSSDYALKNGQLGMALIAQIAEVQDLSKNMER